MMEIALESIPQQEFNIQLGDSAYSLKLRTPHNTTENCLLVSISKDGKELINNVIAHTNMPLIPYGYMDDNNFIFLGEGQPSYDNFDKVKLYFIGKEEINA